MAWSKLLVSVAFQPHHIPRPQRREASFRHCGRERTRILSRVSFLILIFVRDHLRRSRPRVQIAKAAITGEHVRDAFFHRAVLAVPVHSTCPDVYYCAPRGIAKSLARRSSKRRRRCKSSDTKHQFRKGFQPNAHSSGFSYVFLNKHRNGKTNPDSYWPRSAAPRLI